MPTVLNDKSDTSVYRPSGMATQDHVNGSAPFAFGKSAWFFHYEDRTNKNKFDTGSSKPDYDY